MQCPEERNLNEIMWPPHSRGLHQVAPEQPSPAEPQHLGSQNDEQRHPKRQILLVKDLNRAHYVDRVDVPGPGVGEDRDQHVLLHVERSRIECEFPFTPLEEDPFRDRRGHEVAERDHRDLRRDRGEGQRLAAVPEELVEEGE